MALLLNFPNEVLQHIFDLCFDDDEVYRARTLSMIHPRIAETIQYIQFASRQEWALSCLKRLRREELGPDDGDETEDERASQAESASTYYSDLPATQSTHYSRLWMPRAANPEPKDGWKHEHMAALMSKNLYFTLFHIGPHSKLFHPFLPTYVDTAVSHLIWHWCRGDRLRDDATPEERAQYATRKEDQQLRYKFQLCKAICLTHERNFITYILQHGLEESKFDYKEKSFLNDLDALFAAAATVGSLPAIRWIDYTMRTPYELEAALQNEVPPHVIIPSAYMRVAQEWLNPHRGPAYSQSTELFGTPLEAAIANGHTFVATTIYENMKSTMHKEELKRHLRSAINKSKNKFHGSMLIQLNDWFIEAHRPGIGRQGIYNAYYHMAMWAVEHGHPECVEASFRSLGYFDTRPLRGRSIGDGPFNPNMEEFYCKLNLLWKAAGKGHGHVVQLLHRLLRQQFRPLYFQRFANHALRRAVKRGRLHAAQVLLEAGACPNHTLGVGLISVPSLLRIAARRLDTSMLSLLLKNGAILPINWRSLTEEYSDDDEFDFVDGEIDASIILKRRDIFSYADLDSAERALRHYGDSIWPRDFNEEDVKSMTAFERELDEMELGDY